MTVHGKSAWKTLGCRVLSVKDDTTNQSLATTVIKQVISPRTAHSQRYSIECSLKGLLAVTNIRVQIFS